ncbi:hypothetical protein AOLI_G00330080 [Acnodon oligacanthus]
MRRVSTGTSSGPFPPKSRSAPAGFGSEPFERLCPRPPDPRSVGGYPGLSPQGFVIFRFPRPTSSEFSDCLRFVASADTASACRGTYDRGVLIRIEGVRAADKDEKKTAPAL